MNPLQKNSNFNIKPNKGEELNAQFTSRYPRIPSDYFTFLNSFSLLMNHSETTWFNSISDFNETNTESDFKWNEFEIMSVAVFEGHMEQQQIIKEFWNKHLPIILSVKDTYAFFAIGVAEENFGKVYFGIEPEFEEPELVAHSFDEFISLLLDRSLDTLLLNLFFE